MPFLETYNLHIPSDLETVTTVVSEVTNGSSARKTKKSSHTTNAVEETIRNMAARIENK